LSNRTRVAGNERLLAGHDVTPLSVPQDALEVIHRADDGRVARQPMAIIALCCCILSDRFEDFGSDEPQNAA
jgi:hypothetical protein